MVGDVGWIPAIDIHHVNLVVTVALRRDCDARPVHDWRFAPVAIIYSSIGVVRIDRRVIPRHLIV
jgi:hypothetical protein